MRPTIQYHYGNGIHQITNHMYAHLATSLRTGQSVLWLVGGGSGMAVTLAVAERLRHSHISLIALTAMLTDERYGALNHPDENYRQLCDHGFSIPGATVIRTLTGDTIEQTTQRFADRLGVELAAADESIGLFGIGSDGHTAGIKPHSPGVYSQSLAVCYESEDFSRITMTERAIAQLDHIDIYASGTAKQAVVHEFMTTTVPIASQPAQLLKRHAHADLFTDIKEELT